MPTPHELKTAHASRGARRIRPAVIFLLLLLLLLPLLPSCASASASGRDRAEEGETEREYIVRIRGSESPFELVNGEELDDLIRDGALLWYEEDASLELFDVGGSAADESGAEGGDGSVYYGSELWNLAMIGAEGAFDCGFAGQGIRVGVLDSGVNPHPDFGNRLLPGQNYTDGAQDPDDTSDEFGHGTKVAGLIAGAGESGCIGCAPMAEIVPLKCTDGQTVKVSALCRAIYGGIDDFGCRVLNLSLGIGTDSQALRDAADYAAVKGVVMVSGVGNGGGSRVYYPAAYRSVIGVGAVDRDGAWYDRSNHSDSVFLTAPGADVRTTDARGGYIPVTGCSFAVPAVSGAAAVLLSADGTLTPEKIMSLLSESASDAGSAGYDEYCGWGILNLGEAVRQLGKTPAAPPSCAFLPAEEGSPADAVRNNSDKTVICAYHLAEYAEDGSCLGVTTTRLVIPARGTAAVPAPSGSNAWGQFLTDVYGTPLAEARTARTAASQSGAKPAE